MPQRDSRVAMTCRLIDGQLGQRPVAVLAHAEVDLGDRVEPQPVVGVDQQPDLDAVARRERHRGQQLAGARVLAAQRLHHAVSSGRSAASSGRATSSVTRPPPVASSLPLTFSGRR